MSQEFEFEMGDGTSCTIQYCQDDFFTHSGCSFLSPAFEDHPQLEVAMPNITEQDTTQIVAILSELTMRIRNKVLAVEPGNHFEFTDVGQTYKDMFVVAVEHPNLENRVRLIIAYSRSHIENLNTLPNYLMTQLLPPESKGVSH